MQCVAVVYGSGVYEEDPEGVLSEIGAAPNTTYVLSDEEPTGMRGVPVLLIDGKAHSQKQAKAKGVHVHRASAANWPLSRGLRPGSAEAIRSVAEAQTWISRFLHWEA
jgi:hypothetical protein